MRRKLAGILGFSLAVNGLLMLFFAQAWYQMVPGASASGPFNPHFVRDIGCAYLASGGALAWFLYDARARGGALAGAAFLALHALVHLWDVSAGRESLATMKLDLPDIYMPALLALWIAWPQSPFQTEDANVQMADAQPARHIRPDL